ncbi:hypothetical protein [Streptomyces sp. ZEA17I]|uniref:hypothetical protein n=1 Tax=Streptomyces sp. ZEA17I TaxID=2202516 RepID=UPI00215B5C24|nr:hypothetical protein [Streptomyces sp. ZEA17I]
MTTQERFSVEKPRDRCMCGRAMLTMVMSSTTISWHEAMTRSAMPLPRDRRPDGAVGAGVAWEPVMSGFVSRSEGDEDDAPPQGRSAAPQAR